MPKRIQLSRRKGWRMPSNTTSVARPSRWGNPYQILATGSRELSVRLFREWTALPDMAPYRQRAHDFLWGQNLACWCGPDQLCHADILLEIANAD